MTHRSSESTAVAVALPRAPLHLVATNGPQLQEAHAQMSAWAAHMVGRMDNELAEEQEALRIAIERKWKHTRHKRNVSTLQQRRLFYSKIQEALALGYVIVPNFPLDVFLIRTDADEPTGEETMLTAHRRPVLEQSAEILPVGEGEFRNPEPVTKRTDVYNMGSTEKPDWRYTWTATEFDAIEFPVAVARPSLMQQVSQAMQEKLFDEIGVALDESGRSASRRTGDPVIIGRLRNPRPHGLSLSFFIGWYFDPSRL